jgi:hypothetical protein
MTDNILDRVEAAQQALASALETADAAAIEAAAAAFGDSIADLAASTGPLNGPEAARRAEALRQSLDHSRMRVNFLTDVVARRLDGLATIRGRGRAPVYAREGR